MGGEPARRAVWMALLGALMLAAGCVSTAPEPLPPTQARRPEWRVGDRWVFTRTVASGPPKIVTHEVVAVTPDGYAMRIAGLGADVTRTWTKDLHLARQTVGGQPLNSFEPAARYFSWPLALGMTWTQAFEYRDGRHDGRYINHWRVAERPEPVAVLSGPFVAVRIEQLGGQREALATYWYAPAVRYWVKLESYVDGYVEELMEFRPA